ncbi:hypothetical protein GAYE_SCF66G6866 [Galdieria yellowstonensis]|uniref:1-alkyl-2-acetylglycerophosphocholine esterase n=1 Tax=Galdieria yellowstonensis TaxID=3028027 RepID=A0AAV9IN76_9RHOD|nr:hypothetical protein GAYE_SCF66G6866 [Galdieria yellowstonensis]
MKVSGILVVLLAVPCLAICIQFWLQNLLPTPTGRYTVGTTDILIYRPTGEWKEVNCTRANVCLFGGGPFIAPETDKGLPVDISPPKKVMAQIFYPSKEKSSQWSSQWFSLTQGSKRASVLPDVSFLKWYKRYPHPFVKATVQLFGVRTYYALFLSIANWIKSPALLHVPLAPSSEPWPVVLFSHGLFANRLSYSALCAEIASHGYIVAAVDHTDGSVPLVYFKDGDFLNYRKLTAEERETSAVSQTIRILQAHRRVADLQVLLASLKVLNEGQENVVNLPPPLDFRGKLNLKDVTVMGHSFGGATTLIACYLESRFSKCLAFDPWMEAVPDELTSSFPQLNASVVCIHTESFQTETSLGKVAAILKQSQQSGHFAAHWKLRGASHEAQADYPIYLPRRVQQMLNMSHSQMPPKLVHELDSKIAIQFLRDPQTLSSFVENPSLSAYLQDLKV